MEYERNTTPFLNQKIKEANAIVFENAISSGTYTSESMISLFTGDFSYIVPDNPGAKLSPEPWRKEIKKRKTLAQFFSKNGYRTIGFNTNPLTSAYYGYDKGFHIFRDLLKRSSSIPFVSVWEYTTPWENYYDQIIQEVKKSKDPFFLWIFPTETHAPYITGRSDKWSSSTDKIKVILDKIFSIAGNKTKINLYNDCIRYIDSFIERLYYDLKEFNPIFIVHADHGEGFGEHNFYRHGSDNFYEELIHIPLVVINTSVNERLRKPFSLSDLNDWITGIDTPISNLSLPNGNDWALSKTFDSNWIRACTRTEDYKFIYRPNGTDEFYNLKRDPSEKNSEMGKTPEIEKKLRRMLEEEINRDKEKIRIKNKISSIKGKD
ncbi:hypothetical protein AKJ65_03650 [candidate division MSBL1 archaeon SCGC-AAA259E19]|uniref:Sulfatase N-terminal domain-containing protein n=1 Tax=candidate division MSBL1 archaeon SCGC-AAA259E19 TaxID=1698264 RepID=A0A133UKJ9_9EURY|nr:hypothetical protein AKJ65_03650 [candidate division MSBL1 archaeon SCGC-AAA259E19]